MPNDNADPFCCTVSMVLGVTEGRIKVQLRLAKFAPVRQAPVGASARA